MTSPPPLPSWATPKAVAGPPAPDSPLDRQFAAFVGPRWPRYRRKFTPFFADTRFQPTWNWAAALTLPLFAVWFLYRKLYLPFVFFALAPGLVFGLLWGDQSPLIGTTPAAPATATAPVAAPSTAPPAPVVPTTASPFPDLTPDAKLVAFGVILSMAILAGGSANFLLYRRATAAIRVVTPRTPDAESSIALLQRIGGTSWRAVTIGVAVMLLLELLRLGLPTL